MSVRPPLRVSVTRHGEKEQKLKEFVGRHLAESDIGAGSQASQILVVARSLHSPLVKALTALADEIAAVRLTVRLILAHFDQEPEDWGRNIAFAHELRWAKHPRLIEAHEQLVLSPEICWIGDCMRRDPAKCDAYESFVEDCGEADRLRDRVLRAAVAGERAPGGARVTRCEPRRARSPAADGRGLVPTDSRNAPLRRRQTARVAQSGNLKLGFGSAGLGRRCKLG